jgi:1-acyl-sn-glycerol-3-phosphate acyltransferase
MRTPRSEAFILKSRKYLLPVLKSLFGCEVFGMEKLDADQKYLLVGNHSVGVIIEGFMLLDAWENKFKGRSACYALAHRFFFNFPVINSIMKKVGCIPATYEGSQEAFAEGSSVLVFPGGNYEAMRTYSEREVCDFGLKKGWIKVALKNQVPVVPVSIAGSHFVNPNFVRSRFMSYVMILPILFRVKWFPVSLSQIVYATLVAVLTSFFLPLWAVFILTYFTFGLGYFLPIIPAHVRAQIDDPIDLMSLNTKNKTIDELIADPDFLQICYNLVLRTVQKNMDSLNGLIR